MSELEKKVPEISVRVSYLTKDKDKEIPFFRNVVALASVAVGNIIVINNVRVVKTAEDKPMFVSMPSVKTKFGYKEISYFPDKEIRIAMTETVISEVQKAIEARTKEA